MKILILIFALIIAALLLIPYEVEGEPVESVATTTLATTTVTIATTTKTTYEIVAEAFADNPRMIDVIRCESNFRQFHNGVPLVSRTSDVGVMQINQVHWPRARALGLDIFNSIEDNIAMGKIILREQSISAWTCHRLI